MIRKKRQAWKAFKNYGTQENLDKYKKLEREVVKKVRNAKRRLEKEIATAREKNSRKFTEYIKSKTKSRSSIGPLRIEGRTITEDQDMAEHFNSFFASVLPREDTSTIPQILPKTGAQLDKIEVTDGAVKRIINKLKE